MKQQYVPYWEWEDWINGMWRKLPIEEEERMKVKSIEFMSDYVKYGDAMRCVIKEWPRTMLNSMTNKSINRKAFLGQCACAFEFNCPEYITRSVWKTLTDKQRYLADMAAQETINNYERENRGVYRNLEEPMLF